MLLNKNSPIPLYYQLAEYLRERIKAGEYAPGDKLPAERELCEQTGVSRMTVRQALTYLTRDGVLVARPGVGTFVAESKLTYDALHLLGFTEEMMKVGGVVTSRVIEQAVVEPPQHVASKLSLPPGQSAIRIVRLRLAGATPMLLETTYVPAALCAGLEHENLAVNSLYVLMEQRYGLRLKFARQTLETVSTNEFESLHFELPAGTPMFLLEGVTYIDNGQPAEYFKAAYRGDRFKFALTSQRDFANESSDVPHLSVVMT